MPNAALEPIIYTRVAALTVPDEDEGKTQLAAELTVPDAQLFATQLHPSQPIWGIFLQLLNIQLNVTLYSLKPGSVIEGVVAWRPGENSYRLMIVIEKEEANTARVMQEMVVKCMPHEIPKMPGLGPQITRMVTAEGLESDVVHGAHGCALEVIKLPNSEEASKKFAVSFFVNHPSFQKVEVKYQGFLPPGCKVHGDLRIHDEINEPGQSRALIRMETESHIFSALSGMPLVPKTMKETQLSKFVEISNTKLPIRMKQLGELIPHNVEVITTLGATIYHLFRDASGKLFASMAGEGHLHKPHQFIKYVNYETVTVNAPKDMLPESILKDGFSLQVGAHRDRVDIGSVPVRIIRTGQGDLSLVIFIDEKKDWFEPGFLTSHGPGNTVQHSYLFTPSELGLSVQKHYMPGALIYHEGKTFAVVEVDDGIPTKLMMLTSDPVPHIDQSFVLDGVVYMVTGKDVTVETPMDAVQLLGNPKIVYSEGKPLHKLSLMAMQVGHIPKKIINLEPPPPDAITKAEVDAMAEDDAAFKKGVQEQIKEKLKVFKEVMTPIQLEPEEEDEFDSQTLENQTVTDEEFEGVHGEKPDFAKKIDEAVFRLHDLFPGSCIIALQPEPGTHGPNATIDVPAVGADHKLNWDAMAAVILSVQGLSAILQKETPQTNGTVVFRVLVYKNNGLASAYDQSPANPIHKTTWPPVQEAAKALHNVDEDGYPEEQEHPIKFQVTPSLAPVGPGVVDIAAELFKLGSEWKGGDTPEICAAAFEKADKIQDELKAKYGNVAPVTAQQQKMLIFFQDLDHLAKMVAISVTVPQMEAAQSFAQKIIAKMNVEKAHAKLMDEPMTSPPETEFTVGVDVGAHGGDQTVVAVKQGKNYTILQPCYANGEHEWLTTGDSIFCNICGLKQNGKAGTITLPKAPKKGETITVAYEIGKPAFPVQNFLEKTGLLRSRNKPTSKGNAQVAAKLMQKINELEKSLIAAKAGTAGALAGAKSWKDKFETLQNTLTEVARKSLEEAQQRDQQSALKARFSNLADGLEEHP